MHPSLTPDLFGYIAPAPKERRKRKVMSSTDNQCAALAATADGLDAELARVSEEITEAIDDVRMAIVGLVDDGSEVEIDFMLQNLDDDLTDLIRGVRRKVFE